MKNSSSILVVILFFLCLLAGVAGFMIGRWIFPAEVQHVEVPSEVKQKLVLLRDSIAFLEKIADSLEESTQELLNRLPPQQPPRSVDTVRVTVPRAVIDTVEFYKDAYPRLYSIMRSLQRENLYLRALVSKQKNAMELLKQQSRVYGKEIVKLKRENLILKAGMIVLVGVVLLRS